MAKWHLRLLALRGNDEMAVWPLSLAKSPSFFLKSFACCVITVHLLLFVIEDDIKKAKPNLPTSRCIGSFDTVPRCSFEVITSPRQGSEGYNSSLPSVESRSGLIGVIEIANQEHGLRAKFPAFITRNWLLAHCWLHNIKKKSTSMV